MVRRAFALTALSALVGAVASSRSPAYSGAANGPTGTLRGSTQISFGCPGPISPTVSACHPWRPFPGARFSVARRSASGAPVPGTAIVVTSTAQARFSLRLGVGSYLVTPLPQRSTRGGARLAVRVREGAVTLALVRFLGFPQML
jgi:hypothetical protein